MDSQFTNWDLLSYPGLILAVVTVVGALKKLWTNWVKGKEAHLVVITSFALGIASKLTIPNAFTNVHWLTFIISLFGVAIGAMAAHDRLVNPLLANKKSPTQK